MAFRKYAPGTHEFIPMPTFDSVKDSGARQNFETGSVRDTRDGKGRFDLLPPAVLRRDARHMENGARKYGDHNWTKGQPLSRYLDSAFRHLVCMMEGLTDEDHAAAVRWNIGAFMWTEGEIAEGRLPSTLNDLYWPVAMAKMRALCQEVLDRKPEKDRPAGASSSSLAADITLTAAADHLQRSLVEQRGGLHKLTERDHRTIGEVNWLTRDDQ